MKKIPIALVLTIGMCAARAGQVTYLAYANVDSVTGNSARYQNLLGSPVNVGDPFRIYFTVETTTPQSLVPYSGGPLFPPNLLVWNGAVTKIRVLIGNDEIPTTAVLPPLSNGTTFFGNIDILSNDGYAQTHLYRNQMDVDTHIQIPPNQPVECLYQPLNFPGTPTPNAVLPLIVSLNDLPDVSVFAMPVMGGQTCTFVDPTGVEDPESSIFGSTLSFKQVGGPVGSDYDGDGIPDLIDPCPADPLNLCAPGSSSAAVVSAAAGGTLATPDGRVTLQVAPGAIASDATISVTSLPQSSATANIGVGYASGTFGILAAYEFGPDGLQFNSPASLTVTLDVTALTPVERANIDLYRFTDTNGDGINDAYVPAGANCSVVENPVGTFTAICSYQQNHFSLYALLGPKDTDGDGILDNFAGQVDRCPTQNAKGFDVDQDGCIDSFGGLTDLINKLVMQGVIATATQNSLISKVNNAQASATKDNICAAINQLVAFDQQVNAQIGKKISTEAAATVTRYTDSVRAYQRTLLPAGASCP